ncbi:hypothetical protein [Microbispora sp. H11081]|uniref:hypothetical protein n=1 Tax=Microbispora sp. H11081 TaxID=2729107 RepID=UPI001B8AD455|nr:hypothetical protein [Microbispora sp. H11081]
MPKFKTVFAGLALGTAIAGSAIAMSSTAANAEGFGGGFGGGFLGGGMPMFNNFVPIDFGGNEGCGGGCGGGGFGNGFGNGFCNNDNNMFWNQQGMWNQNAFTDNVDDNSGFAIIGKNAAIAFQDKTNRNTNWFNNGFWNNNTFMNNRNNNNVWNNPGFGNGF